MKEEDLSEEAKEWLAKCRSLTGQAQWDFIAERELQNGFPEGTPLAVGKKRLITEDPKWLKRLQQLPEYQTSDSPEPITRKDAEGQTWEFRRQFTSRFGKLGMYKEVTLWTNQETGKVKAWITHFLPWVSRLEFVCTTQDARRMGTLPAAEETARRRLLRELSECQANDYLLSDQFCEQGKSGIRYLLRKNRPTVALRDLGDGRTRTLCALCMHPQAFYEGSWAGSMAPSDEVLTHLLFIRADEHLYWRKANQIHPSQPNSGI